MNRLLIMVSLLAMLICLTGCQGIINSGEETETIIDWMDFININDREYDVLYEVVITDDSYIGEKVGKVKFNVADNVDDPEYETKEGDAAFHKKGTPIYSVEDAQDLIAVKDEDKVNGYRIYQANDADKQWDQDYPQLENDEVVQIEIQKGLNQPELIAELTEKEMETLFEMLDNGTTRQDEDEVPEEEPDVYRLVFYRAEPVASSYELLHEGEDWYWYPREAEKLPDEIEKLIE